MAKSALDSFQTLFLNYYKKKERGEENSKCRVQTFRLYFYMNTDVERARILRKGN